MTVRELLKECDFSVIARLLSDDENDWYEDASMVCYYKEAYDVFLHTESSVEGCTDVAVMVDRLADGSCYPRCVLPETEWNRVTDSTLLLPTDHQFRSEEIAANLLYNLLLTDFDDSGLPEPAYNPSFDELKQQFGTYHINYGSSTTRAYDADGRLSYLMQLIDRYDAFWFCPCTGKSVVHINTSDAFPLREAELAAIRQKFATLLGRDDTEFVIGTDNTLGQDMHVHLAGLEKKYVMF